jgi:hypothetical protein
MGVDDFYIKARNVNAHIHHDIFIYGFDKTQNLFYSLLYKDGQFASTMIKLNVA